MPWYVFLWTDSITGMDDTSWIYATARFSNNKKIVQSFYEIRLLYSDFERAPFTKKNRIERRLSRDSPQNQYQSTQEKWDIPK